MESARSGLVGRLATGRPLLIGAVIIFGLVTLAITGGSRTPGFATPDSITAFIFSVLMLIAAPSVAAAFSPRDGWRRILVFIAFGLALGLVHFTGERFVESSVADPLFDKTVLGAALALAAWLIAFRPAIGGVLRLAMIGPFISILAAIAALGYFALDGAAAVSSVIPALSLSMGLSMVIAVEVAGDFAGYFVRGEDKTGAAAAAAHQAVAPTVFAILCAGSAFLAQLLFPEGQSVEGETVWYAIVAATLGCGSTLFISAGSMSLIRVNEKIALHENWRRSDVRLTWRPVRKLLPATSAYTVVGLVLIGVVLAVFETERSMAPDIATFVLFIAFASLIAFVSLRTTILLLAMLIFGNLFAGLLYAATGALPLSGGEQLSALALAAAAFSHLALAWRDSAHPRLNAREVTETAMTNGVGKFLVTMAMGVSAFLVADVSGLWPGGALAAGHFAITTGLGLLMAPALMTVISARYNRY